MVVAAGQQRLVARRAVADLEAGDQAQRGQQLERAVDARDADAPVAPAQPVVDLLRREAAVLLGQQLHHREASAARPVPRGRSASVVCSTQSWLVAASIAAHDSRSHRRLGRVW